MKRVLATTALVALTAMPAFAQTMTTSTDDTMVSQNDTTGSMFNMNGMQLSADGTAGLDGPADDWENIGSVNDVLFDANGEIAAVVLDIGGFLGIGARSVALAFDDLQISRDEGGLTSSFNIWVNLTEEQLENMPEWTGDN